MTILPQCLRCKHRREPVGGVPTCDAYEDAESGIPWAILLNQHDHREPYKGDGGVRFEADASTGPRTNAKG